MQTEAHQNARRQLQARADGPLGPDEQVALERHLAGCPECRAYAARLEALESRLSDSLQARWPLKDLNEHSRPHMQALLGEINATTRRHPMQSTKPRSGQILVWIGLVALIIVIVSFSVRTLAPAPAASPQSSEAPATLNAPVDSSTSQPTTIPQGTITATLAPPVSGSTSLFPQLQFSFANPLPSSPDQLNVYRMVLGEALTPENALAQAEAMGIHGRVFSQASEGMGNSLYAVSDGYSLARFLNFPTQFLFWPGTAGLASQHGELPPLEQLAAPAESFLKEHGLLDEAYRVEPLEGERGGVNFVRLLDGLPVISGIGVNRSLIEYNRVIVDPQGQVLEVTHSQPGFEPQGQFPILSAGQAWERLSQDNALQRLRYAVLDPQIPDSLQTWLRQLPLNQPLDLYGYTDLMTPATGDPTPLVMFQNVLARGAIAGMLPGNFLHVRGQLSEDENGRQVLQVDSWKASELEDTTVEGVLTRSGADQGQLASDDGRNFTLNELPPDMSDGARIEARGVVVGGVLDWWVINSGGVSLPYGTALSCMGGGGGGSGSGLPLSSFGEGFLAIPNLSSQPATATPTIDVPGMPAVGTLLEAVIGQASVVIHEYADSTQMEVNLNLDAGVLGEYPVYLRLEGDSLAGIEAYANLPVRVWGQVVRQENYQSVVQVERYEPAYPGLQVQAWLGTQSAVTLEGKPVVLLTAQDGSQYVVKQSIDYGTDAMVGRPGDLVVYEGLAIPGESFAGYPVLREFSASMADGITDISQYQITQNAPIVLDETQSVENPRLQISGNVTIDQAELAYAALSTHNCTAADASNPDMAGQLLVQPIWRFMGNFEDGRRIEIQVSALPEDYFGP